MKLNRFNIIRTYVELQIVIVLFYGTLLQMLAAQSHPIVFDHVPTQKRNFPLKRMPFVFDLKR